MATEFTTSAETEKYFSARRSLMISNGDKPFQDKSNHSDKLVLNVIQTYSSVFIEPMLARIEEKEIEAPY
jgi:hypothetical protein